MIRLLRLELRHNAVPLILPVIAALFWLTTYRKIAGMQPLWNVRSQTLQMESVIDFVAPLAGAAAWMGSRESRRRVTDMVTITPRARWARRLVTWAATTIWALVVYLVCVAVIYGQTSTQASWGGPLWWPVAVAGVAMAAFTALGFAAGVLAPSRFTAPLAAIVAFFVLALSTELIGHASNSYWQVTPIVAYIWGVGPNPGVATFYPYLPDLPIAQVMFLAGLTVAIMAALGLSAGTQSRALRAAAAATTAAGLAAATTAVMLAGTATVDAHGMIRIPALHDAANDRPIRFTPVCSHTAIPVCLNPAYSSLLASTAAALEPVLNQIAGLPGAPAQILQEAATYQGSADGGVGVVRGGPGNNGPAAVYHLILPIQQLGPPLTTAQMASQVRGDSSWDLATDFTGDGPGASQAQDAVAASIIIDSKVPMATTVFISGVPSGADPSRSASMTPGTPQYAAAQRFAALPEQTRRAWLASHMEALRAGQITLAQLP
jgi:hypothetical protein